MDERLQNQANTNDNPAKTLSELPSFEEHMQSLNKENHPEQTPGHSEEKDTYEEEDESVGNRIEDMLYSHEGDFELSSTSEFGDLQFNSYKTNLDSEDKENTAIIRVLAQDIFNLPNLDKDKKTYEAAKRKLAILQDYDIKCKLKRLKPGKEGFDTIMSQKIAETRSKRNKLGEKWESADKESYLDAILEIQELEIEYDDYRKAYEEYEKALRREEQENDPDYDPDWDPDRY